MSDNIIIYVFTSHSTLTMLQIRREGNNNVRRCLASMGEYKKTMESAQHLENKQKKANSRMDDVNNVKKISS